VGRICLDMLRTRRAKREDYAGSWLPEPIVGPADGGPVAASPEADAVMADSVGLALLIVLETLTPAERLAFVLHDVFAVPFEEIATVVDRSPTAARQLASRARRQINAAKPEPDADLRPTTSSTRSSRPPGPVTSRRSSRPRSGCRATHRWRRRGPLRARPWRCRAGR
jgi:hypothetical protein